MEENSNDALRKELDGIYTPLSVAKEEIWRRWNDKELRKKVEDFLEGDVPEILKNGPRAVLSRNVSSPNFELLHFLDLSKKTNLRPLCLEYVKDKFVSKNWDKYYLGRMFFFEDVDKKCGPKISSLKVVDFDQYDGEKFSDIKTIWGDPLVRFHHSLVHSLVSDKDIVDMSDNYKRNGHKASEYYRYIISLFVCHGVLFENFLLSDIYSDLTRDIFLPNYREIEKKFGIKPLIVQLVPTEKENSIYWRYYSNIIKDEVCAIIKKEKKI